MRTITIDIIDEKAVNLLKDLELLKLIKVRKEKPAAKSTDWGKYKGAMTRQSLLDIDKQLDDLRGEWE